MRMLVALSIGIILLGAPCWSDNAFTDVPDDHWAKEAVDMMAKAGIMNGCPDGKFNGDRPVTRYELSVALANMLEFIQASQKPVESGKSKASEIKPSMHWAQSSRQFLKCEGFLPKDSPVLKDGKKPVTFTELGEALALVSAKLIETSVPPTSAPN
ncbi:MAG: S-layer homology domain-containing protein [Armatimonadota bacterium]|nr:S-layer homology domain-containing protein [bacterium]